MKFEVTTKKIDQDILKQVSPQFTHMMLLKEVLLETKENAAVSLNDSVTCCKDICFSEQELEEL